MHWFIVLMVCMAMFITPGHAEEALKKQRVEFPSDYYERLRVQECPKAANESCCRASVTAMQKIHARALEPGQDCPEDFRKRSIRCPSSLTWCEYLPGWEDTPLFSPGQRE